MKKLVVWATAGLFALSLQGSALAQKEEKAPGGISPSMESPAPMAPGEAPVTPEKVQKASNKKNQKSAKTQKTSKKKTKKKKTKKKVV